MNINGMANVNGLRYLKDKAVATFNNQSGLWKLHACKGRAVMAYLAHHLPGVDGALKFLNRDKTGTPLEILCLGHDIDTYDVTVLWKSWTNKFSLECWGDLMERDFITANGYRVDNRRWELQCIEKIPPTWVGNPAWWIR